MIARRPHFDCAPLHVATIDRYVAQANDDPKPFMWTASAASIMAKLKMHHPNESEHYFFVCEEPMSRPEIPNLRMWSRNLSTSQYGGLSTSQYGGMSTSQYGGASTSQYGGLSSSQYGGMSASQYGGLSSSQYGGLSASQYGGLSTSQYGGLSTSQYGGLSSSQGGGMSTSSSNPYKSNIPPWPHFLRELEIRNLNQASSLIRKYLPSDLWPENFFRS